MTPSFEIGKIYHRQSEIHATYKGQSQGGISTPSGLGCIFIFTGDAGEQHGYSDHFTDEGIFNYTGEGQIGDMPMVRGNKAIRDNVKDGRTIHLFEYVKKAHVRYNGKADCIGYHEEQKPDREGNMRSAFVFHLLMNVADESVVEPGTLTSENDTEKATKEVNKKLKKLKSLEDLRNAALQTSPKTASAPQRRVVSYYRSEALKAYVRARAEGDCEGCNTSAPFISKKGPYLEPHHVHLLADGGPDHPKNVIALCPNCHRQAHYSTDAFEFNSTLIERLSHIEK